MFSDMKKNYDDMISAQKKLMDGIDVLSKIDVSKMGVSEKEVVYSDNKMTLYHYVPKVKKVSSVPTLITYALVNKEHMMDLQEGKSFIGGLLEKGLDLYIIDWGFPTKDDMFQTIEDYILGYMDTCVDIIRERTGNDKINLMGICQGGTFSIIYTALRQEKIKNLVTFVVPFDFGTEDKLLFKWGKYLPIDKMVDAYGVIPGDFMNNGFLMLQPVSLMLNKYINLVDNLDDIDAMTNFMAMEKWIFTSPGQAGETIRTFVKDLFRDNKLIKGELVVGGEKVDVKNITCPLLNVFAKKDHQVPNASSEPLPKHVSSKDTENVLVDTGHIGLFVSGKSQREVVPKVAQFILDRQ